MSSTTTTLTVMMTTTTPLPRTISNYRKDFSSNIFTKVLLLVLMVAVTSALQQQQQLHQLRRWQQTKGRLQQSLRQRKLECKMKSLGHHNDNDHNNMMLLNSYLRRIGFLPEEADEFINIDKPNMDNLQRLLTNHLLHVPFENMDQHYHPSHHCQQHEIMTQEIPRRTGTNLPSLDVQKSLKKIVYRKRGGFCFELNFSFNWLLSRLGYKTRLALADVSCNQPVPGHVIILVDDIILAEESSGGAESTGTVLVDVGFGNPGVCDVVLPLQYNAPKYDLHGDLFEFETDHTTETDMHTDRFDTALYRYRVSAPNIKEPMYRFRKDDDMDTNAVEFENGLDRVLTTSPFFTEKRICVLSTDRGHVTLGKDYVKWVERGESVCRVELPTETAWRGALKEHFGITLNPEEE